MRGAALGRRQSCGVAAGSDAILCSMTSRTGDLEVHPLTPQRLSDLAELFGQGGAQRYCWCAYFRVRSIEFSTATVAAHRAVLERAVATTATERRAAGLIAYRDQRPIGWVSLGPRDDYQRLQHSKALGPIDDQPVWSLVCFVVSPWARGQGVAAALLDAAIAYAREHGATLLEAYPVETEGERVPDADAYKGTVSMFERAGFEVVARRRANRVSRERPIMRLWLRCRQNG
jgi:ribosomal protein S18 acetylase RimI-like enzyme